MSVHVEHALAADRRWRWSSEGFTAERRPDGLPLLESADTAAVCSALLHDELHAGYGASAWALALSQREGGAEHVLWVGWVTPIGPVRVVLAEGENLGRVVGLALARVWAHGLPPPPPSVAGEVAHA